MKIESDLDFLNAVGQVVIQYRSHVGKLQDKLAIQAEKLTYVNDVLQPEMDALKAENEELKRRRATGEITMDAERQLKEMAEELSRANRMASSLNTECWRHRAEYDELHNRFTVLEGAMRTSVERIMELEFENAKMSRRMLNWSEWTDEPYPSTTCKHIELSATVEVIAPTEENGERCRYWEVKCFGNVIASGYTMMSAAAQYLCETIMENEGKEKAYEIMRMSMNKPNPRVA